MIENLPAKNVTDRLQPHPPLPVISLGIITIITYAIIIAIFAFPQAFTIELEALGIGAGTLTIIILYRSENK